MLTRFIDLLFGEKYVIDDRESVATISILGMSSSLEVLAPQAGLWAQLYLLSLVQKVFQRVIAIAVYYAIVKQRQSTSSYLIGWGFIIPFSLASPFLLIEWLDIQNKILRLSFSTLPYIGTFRTIEAMYNTSPPFVEESLSNYGKYYSTLHHFVWDAKTQLRRRLEWSEFTTNTIDLALTFLLLSLSLSVELYYDYTPFQPSAIDLESFHLDWNQFIQWQHLLNAYGLVVVIYFALKLMFEMDAWSAQVGDWRATQVVFRNPLWASTSPRDFWSRRWNLMIHRILKYGVYKVTMGNLALTFLVSGWIHEYSWRLMGVGTPGKLTAFFLWNGAILMLEPYIPVYRRLLAWKCPVWVVSTLVVVSALPVAHWYTGDWARGGVFEDLKIGLLIFQAKHSE